MQNQKTSASLWLISTLNASLTSFLHASLTNWSVATMMFDRLVESIASGADAAFPGGQSRELQLATAMALVATMSADYIFKPEETRAVVDSLADLFGFDRRKCRKLLARAMAARQRDPSIFNSAMMLRRLGTPGFRGKVLAAADFVANADGELHDYEKDLLQRLERMLVAQEKH